MPLLFPPGGFVTSYRTICRAILRTSIGFIGLIYISGAPARAQVLKPSEQDIVDTLDERMDQLPPDATEVKIGLGPVVTATLDDPGHQKIRPLPLIFFHYKEYLALDENELRLNVLAADSALASSGWRVGPMMEVNFGRRTYSANLSTPGRVNTSLEVGGFVSYSFGPARIRVRARQDVIAGHKGAIAEFDVRSGIYQNGGLTIGIGLMSTWASKRYMTSYYAVTPAQSAASTLAVFAPGAGFKDASVSLIGEYKFSDHWSMAASMQYVRLLGDAANSPITQRRGSEDRINSGVFALYKF